MRVVEAAEQAQGSKSLLSVRLLSSLVPEFGSQLEHGTVGPAGEQREDVAQVRPGLDTVELAAGDQTRRDGIPLGTVVAAAERPVRPADDLTAQFELADVVVEAEPAIVEEACQRLTMVHDVVHRLDQRGC